jgi:hypothetical protein
VEPVMRYQRERFRGSSGTGTPRYDLGLQMKEDAVNRLLEVWAGGEACASLSSQAERLSDPLLDAASKLWSIRYAPGLMREAVKLMGGCGVTEDCPGSLGREWIEAQREAIDDAEDAQRQLGIAMADEQFLPKFCLCISDLQAASLGRAGHGAGALAIAMNMWLWTFERVRDAALVDGLCAILASRAQILDIIARSDNSQVNVGFLADLCHVQAANVCVEVSRVCAELMYGSDDSPAAPGFAGMAALLDDSLAGSLAARNRALEALLRIRIPA